MNETEFKPLLETLHRQLNILREREAKYGGNAPLDLLNQIEDHHSAIALIESRLQGQISTEELEEQLAPLNLSLDRAGTEIVTGIKIGTLVVPTVPLLALLFLIVAVLGGVGWYYFSQVPARMTGRFNVAVAEFGELTPAAIMERSEIGRLVSKWVFDDLQVENEQYPAGNRVELWHDSLPITQKRTEIGFIAGATPQERAAAADVTARNIGADVLTYGYLATQQNPASFILEFYVAPRLADETDSTIGPYQLGEPMRVPPNFDPDDPLSRESLAEPIATRTTALYWLIRGLREELLGRSAEALQIFRQAEAELTNWKDKGEGKEHLYFFIGQSELFLNNDVQAEEAFQKALQLDPTYARARTALGSVYFKRAQCRLLDSQGQNEQNSESYVDVCQRQEGDFIARCQPADGASAACLHSIEQDLERSIENYRQGLELAAADYRPQLGTARARLALGQAYYLQGLVLTDDNEAIRLLDSAIEQIESVLETFGEAEQYRFLGQAYQTLGGAYAQKAAIAREQKNIAGSQALFEQSRAAFNNCIAQGEQIPYYDAILTEQVIANCQSYNEKITEALTSLQGEQ